HGERSWKGHKPCGSHRLGFYLCWLSASYTNGASFTLKYYFVKTVSAGSNY
ncbi:hypothetical protein STEG23_037906, partial [Scotinomys teguina]